MRYLLVFLLYIAVSLAAMPSFSASSHADIQFITLSDIHFDPFIACYSEPRPCRLITKLRSSPVSSWPTLLEESKATPAYRLDTPYSLLQSALIEASEVAASTQAQFVVILGDFLGHDYRQFYKKYSGDSSAAGYHVFVNKTFQFLTNELKETFPTTDIYSVVGNNDSYHRDYSSQPGGPFFQDIGKMWSGLIKNKSNQSAMQGSFSKAGYYAVDIANTNLRLIVLNTVLFSVKANGKNVDAAAASELNWLHTQLVSAKEKNKKVIIALHIPVGVDVYATIRIKLFTLIELWRSTYSARFQADLREFAPIITAIFSGHLHSDWFQVLTFGKDEIPVSGTPAISPIFGNNPGFKVYSYAPSSGKLTNYVTYYYSLDGNKKWTIEYDFNHVYQFGCHDCSLINGMNLVQKEGMLANHYKTFYAVGTSAQPITEKWNPYYWCAIREVDIHAYKQCVG